MRYHESGDTTPVFGSRDPSICPRYTWRKKRRQGRKTLTLRQKRRRHQLSHCDSATTCVEHRQIRQARRDAERFRQALLTTTDEHDTSRSKHEASTVEQEYANVIRTWEQLDRDDLESEPYQVCLELADLVDHYRGWISRRGLGFDYPLDPSNWEEYMAEYEREYESWLEEQRQEPMHQLELTLPPYGRGLLRALFGSRRLGTRRRVSIKNCLRERLVRQGRLERQRQRYLAEAS